MSTSLAFLAPLAAIAVTSEQAHETRIPNFKPRWWFRADRLDARPVIWSLLNHPEEWEFDGRLRYRVIHKPSRHVFWVGSGKGFYRLHRADCGCSSEGGLFQPFQQRAFHRAFRSWRAQQPPMINAQHFTEHFLR